MSDKKTTPVCHACGNFTCADCGAGFPTRHGYLRHRLDALAHEEPAEA